MKTIGLVTYYNSDNFGAMLQAYALKREIEKNGCRCTLISHNRFSVVHKELAGGSGSKTARRVKTGVRHPRSLKMIASGQTKDIKRGKKRAKIKCASFRDEFFPDKTEIFYYNTDQIMKDPPIFDGYVCGSDQIWSPERFTGAEPFFLDFVPEGRPRIAYAPSLAMTTIPDGMKESYKTLVSKFSDVSVREKKGCDAIEEAVGIRPKWVCDPTFLMSQVEWEEFSDVKTDTPERYIFCYFLSKENLLRARGVINKTAAELNAKVLVLPFGEHVIDSRWIGPRDVGPREFTALIRNACYVLTDSFHGTSLSILLEKNFNVYAGMKTAEFANRFDRIANILKLSGLENRAFTDASDLKPSDIPYEAVYEKLYPFIKSSKRFLKEALDKVEEQPPVKHKPPRLASYESCTGCSACAAACPFGAVTMQPDHAGFWRPVIREELCVHCGKCEKKCPVRNPAPKSPVRPDYYAIYARDPEMRMRGSSGNAGGLFSEVILKENGEVFGAALSDDCRELSFKSASEVGLEKLQKSKYFEAGMRDVILRIREQLDLGKKVMFTGTPCQAAGVRKIFGGNPNLLICDFICHGVTPAKWFGLYLDEMEALYGAKAVDVGFRSKAMGWRLYCMKIEFDNGKTYLKSQAADPYMLDFFENNHLRTNCYSCSRALHSVADITLGDYWAVNVKHNMKDTDEGISFVCLRTEKAKRFFEENFIGNEAVFVQKLSDGEVDETLVSRVRKVPKGNDIIPEKFNIKPQLGAKGNIKKLYYEQYVRKKKQRDTAPKATSEKK